MAYPPECGRHTAFVFHYSPWHKNLTHPLPKNVKHSNLSPATAFVFHSPSSQLLSLVLQEKLSIFQQNSSSSAHPFPHPSSFYLQKFFG